MRTFLWVVVGLNQLVILLIGAVDLDQFELSEFAFRERLAHHSGESARLHRQLHKLLPEVRLLQKVELTIAASISVVIFSYLQNPALGTLYALGALLLIAILSRLQIVKQQATKLFESTLGVVLLVTTKLHPLWVVIGIPAPRVVVQPGSQAEFTDQLRRLPSTVLNPIQRQRLETVLASEEKTVKDIMTPKKRVITVEPAATLGPIVLSDLQKSGHGYFPVATKKGEPEGILTLGDLGDIQAAKQRASVRDLMSEQVAWVEESTSLYELANAFLQEKQYLILVRNINAEFSGIVTVADFMKHTLGVVKD